MEKNPGNQILDLCNTDRDIDRQTDIEANRQTQRQTIRYLSRYTETKYNYVFVQI